MWRGRRDRKTEAVVEEYRKALQTAMEPLRELAEALPAFHVLADVTAGVDVADAGPIVTVRASLVNAGRSGLDTHVITDGRVEVMPDAVHFQDSAVSRTWLFAEITWVRTETDRILFLVEGCEEMSGVCLPWRCVEPVAYLVSWLRKVDRGDHAARAAADRLAVVRRQVAEERERVRVALRDSRQRL